MKSGSNLPGSSENRIHKNLAAGAKEPESNLPQKTDVSHVREEARQINSSEGVGKLPVRVRATVVVRRGEYDARRLRSQRDVIRDVMIAATDCDTWLTLGELRALTRYGEASISAQLRHLRKPENGAYEIIKRRRDELVSARGAKDGRGECTWEYRIARPVSKQPNATSETTREFAGIL